jgi:L-Ala-D/L-Glu epimerase
MKKEKTINFTWEPITLDLKTTFRIAHGASDQRHNVLVHIGEGTGEAAGVVQHGENQASIIAYLEKIKDQSWNTQYLEDTINNLPIGSQAGKAAIDIALHDLLGKELGLPLYELFGLNPQKAPETAYTIAIDAPDAMAAQAQEAQMPILKIKVGGQDDEAILAAIRGVYSGRLLVDANTAWERQQAAKIIPRLAEYGIEMIEQPLATGDIEGLQWLKKQKLGIPIFADENIKSSRDVAEHAGAVDGVVIKLMKSGGIREALRAIHTARAFDMKVMIGCMVETSVGVSAAAHISPLCDYADLDGPLLIKNDPYEGVGYKGAQLILPEAPGLGIQKRIAY